MIELTVFLLHLFLILLSAAVICVVGYLAAYSCVALWHNDVSHYLAAVDRIRDFYERFDAACDEFLFAFLIFVCAVVGVIQVLSFLRV